MFLCFFFTSNQLSFETKKKLKMNRKDKREKQGESKQNFSGLGQRKQKKRTSCLLTYSTSCCSQKRENLNLLIAKIVFQLVRNNAWKITKIERKTFFLFFCSFFFFSCLGFFLFSPFFFVQIKAAYLVFSTQSFFHFE